MATDEEIRAKDVIPKITEFREGDGFYGDGPTSFFMDHQDVANNVVKDSANNTAATESDLVAGSKLPIMTANGPKSLPGNTIAKSSEQIALTTYAQNVAHSIAPEFDPTRTSDNPYKAWVEPVMNGGKTYVFKTDHYGAWTGSDVMEVQTGTQKYFALTWETGKLFNVYGGETANASWDISDYIPVPLEGVEVQAKVHDQATFTMYDKDKNLIGTIKNLNASPANFKTVVYPYTLDTAVAYVRLSNRNNASDYFARTPLAYPEKPLSIGAESLVFDINDLNITWTSGKYISASGDIGNSSANQVSSFIRIPLNGIRYKVYIGASQKVAIYDKDFTFKGVIGHNSTGYFTGTLKKSDLEFDAEYVRFTTALYTPFYVVANENFAEIVDVSKSVKSIGKDSLNFVRHEADTNMINKNALTNNLVCMGAPSEGGVCGSATSDFCVTELIPVVPETTYDYKFISPINYAYYDENKAFVNGRGTDSEAGDAGALSGYKFTVPAGCYYVRFTINDPDNIGPAYVGNRAPYQKQVDGSLNLRGVDENNPCLYIGKEVSVFKKGLAIGDSLTQGVFNEYSGQSPGNVVAIPDYSWPTLFEKMYGVPFDNMGVGGQSIESWWAMKQNEDFSGHDFAVIALGVNNAVSSGTMWQASTTTAMNGIIAKLKTENAGIKIFVCTTFAGGGYVNTRFAEISQDIRDYVESLNDPQVFLVDMYQYSTADKWDLWNGHANATGYRQIAEDLGSYISAIIATNKNSFDDVQFIGTNYQHDQ